jgi:hypothetical protein
MAPRAANDYDNNFDGFISNEDIVSEESDWEDEIECEWCGKAELECIVWDWKGDAINTCLECLIEVADVCPVCDMFLTLECFEEGGDQCSICRENNELDDIHEADAESNEDDDVIW